jgi:hypothetical protein
MLLAPGLVKTLSVIPELSWDQQGGAANAAPIKTATATTSCRTPRVDSRAIKSEFVGARYRTVAFYAPMFS